MAFQPPVLHVIGFALNLPQAVPEIIFRDVRRAGQFRLPRMRLERQPVQQFQQLVFADFQHFRQARLFKRFLPGGVRDDFAAFPPIQQQFGRVAVEFAALFRQAAAPVRMQARHQRQQQRAAGEIRKLFAAENRAFEQLGAAAALLRRHAPRASDMLIPAIRKPADLAFGKGRKRGVRKTGERMRIRIRAAGHEDAALVELFRRVFNRLLRLTAASVGFRHFIEAVEQQQRVPPR